MKTTQEKLDAAIEVIKFYADRKNWSYSDSSMQFDIYGNINLEDCYNENLGEGGGIEVGGKKAREFLKSLEVLKWNIIYTYMQRYF